VIAAEARTAASERVMFATSPAVIFGRAMMWMSAPTTGRMNSRTIQPAVATPERSSRRKMHHPG
jgi:hypothetical protein